MELKLTPEQKNQLESQHRKERDGRIRDRIKAVLLRSEGWTNHAIAQALRIHEETVREHVSEWLENEKLKPENGGSSGKLKDHQCRELDAHLRGQVYTKVIDICGYVEKSYGVFYTVSGMTKWLKEHDFSYKQPKAIPAKADLEKQEAFIGEYLDLQEKTPINEPILFMDSAHPTMATKVVCGWIKKGVDHPIAQTASRTRINVVGAINLSEMKLSYCCPESVNGESVVAFFKQLKADYPDAPKIHIILDQSGYHRCKLVEEAAAAESIILHYLPPYSPNLNAIERLWKVMNERVRNNRFFASAKEFRGAILGFFEDELPCIIQSLRSRINDNFQTLKAVPSG